MAEHDAEYIAELTRSLYMSTQGEVKLFPGYDGQQSLTEMRAERPLTHMDVSYDTVRWEPIRFLSQPIQKALVSLYLEREEARELAFALHWHQLFGERWNFTEDSSLHRHAYEHEWIREHPRPEKK